MTGGSETRTEGRQCPKHGPYEAKIAAILGREIASRCPACAAE